jgi:hypothetical protein
MNANDRLQRIVVNAQVYALECGDSPDNWYFYVSDSEAKEIADMGVAI